MARINAVSFHEDPYLESICRKALDAGFDSLEVSRPPFFDRLPTAGARNLFLKWARSKGLKLHGFDCWVEVDPYRARAQTLDCFRSAMEFASDLSLGMVITHDPWAHVNQDRSSADCLHQNIAFFGEVADLAEARQLSLVFEPHPDTWSMDPAWAEDFIDGIGRSNVGLLYDCCHYGVGHPTRYIEMIRRLGPRIKHVHYSDGDRKTYALHLPLGDGELDLDGIVAGLQEIGFKGTLTNDMYHCPLLEDGARRNVESVRAVEQKLGLAS